MSKKIKKEKNLENEAQYLIGCLYAQQLIDKIGTAEFENEFLEYLGAKDKEMEAYTAFLEEKDPLQKDIGRVIWKHLRAKTLEKLEKYENRKRPT